MIGKSSKEQRQAPSAQQLTRTAYVQPYAAADN